MSKFLRLYFLLASRFLFSVQALTTISLSQRNKAVVVMNLWRNFTAGLSCISCYGDFLGTCVFEVIPRGQSSGFRFISLAAYLSLFGEGTISNSRRQLLREQSRAR